MSGRSFPRNIAPIEVLRHTVQRWANESQLPEAPETAHNMLLLLDPELLGDKPVKPPVQPALEAPDDKVWAPLPHQVLQVVGRGPPYKLVEPPPAIMPPSGYSSLSLRQAAAYATWLEQACAAIATCLGTSDTAPSSVCCKRLEKGLGPAAIWLRAVGATFHADGLDFVKG